MENDNKFYALVLKSKTTEGYNFDKVEIQLGKKIENWVEILNFNTLKDKEILGKGSFLPTE